MIKLRKIKAKDIWLLYSWVNKEDSLKNKIKTDERISKVNHEEWFKNSLNNDTRLIWIVNKDNKDIGQVRIDINREWKLGLIDIFIEKQYRKLKVGKTSLLEAIEYVDMNFDIEYMAANILNSNINSFKFFQNLGFEQYKDYGHYKELRLKLSILDYTKSVL